MEISPVTSYSMRNTSEPPPLVYYGPDIPPPPDLSPSFSPTGGVVVRAEEALIVVLVLVLWVGAIALFFNRWGKIRMLEPYQPKFHQEHRPSCPMATATDSRHEQGRASISKYNLMEGGYLLRNPSTSRPRQNSVFIGGSPAYKVNPPRKTKSAADLHSLVGADPPPRPLPLTAARRPSSVGYLSPRRPSCFCPEERRPSFTNVLAQVTAERRPSFTNVLAQVNAERRPSFSNVLAQVTAERRPSSSLLRISNV